ncbi:protein-glutamine gamma-glutamyltransferase K-like [Glandiceps talaboti]
MNKTDLSREYVDKPPTPPPSDKQLKVTTLDIQLEVNRRAHHTDEYELNNLIVRRGQSFDITVTFDRPYNEDNDKITLEMKMGEPPHRISKGTLVKVPFVDGEFSSYDWGAKILSKEGSTVTLSIFLPVIAYVGRYLFGMEIVTGKDEDAVKFRHDMKEPIFVLFNAWCKDDTVYIEGALEKEEYVLNDTGFIWYGNYKQPRKRRWIFGQYDEEVFPAVMYLLENGMNLHARNNPVYVTRAMSAITNAPDDGGVLVGNWSGNYASGTKPTKWTGSVAILEQYNRTKQPVQFGQCWVFSGVLTTVLRCLGIPTRSVTNYKSAHDTDGSLTIDHHKDQDGFEIDPLNSDSVWNYHVWNDCWMARPDLPSGYGGWQAVDATPQERSEGLFWTGPAPLAAVKQGHVYVGYDTGFVFSEVNADRIEWVCKVKDGYIDDMTPVTIKKSAVGMKISTKSIMSNDREDITHQYKHPNGSEEERMAVRCAVEHGTRPDTYNRDIKPDDVEMWIDTGDEVTIGDQFDVKVFISNKSSETRTLDIFVSSHVCHYTGVPIRNSRCKADHIDLVIEGNEQLDVKMRVTREDYLHKLVDQTSMKIYAMGKVRETDQMWSDQDDFRVDTPDLTLETKGEIKVGKAFKVKVYLKNPLPHALTSCTLDVEGPGLQRPKVIKQRTVPGLGELKTEVELTPRKAGKKVIVISFDSDQLTQVTGSLDIEVEK